MKDKKTGELKIRCTQNEKKRIAERAKSAGKTLSEFAREMLLKGKVVAVPKLTETEKSGIKVLYGYANNFTLIGNYIKNKDGRLYNEIRMLVTEIKDVIERHFKA